MIPNMVMKRWYIKGETLPERCVCGGEWKDIEGTDVTDLKFLTCTKCSRWIAEVEENGQTP